MLSGAENPPNTASSVFRASANCAAVIVPGFLRKELPGHGAGSAKYRLRFAKMLVAALTSVAWPVYRKSCADSASLYAFHA